MNIRRWGVGVLAATLFVPGLAACKSDEPAPAAGGPAASAVPSDPKEALLASMKEIEKGNFTFVVTSDGDFAVSGTVHLPSKSAEMKMGGQATEDLTMQTHFVHIDADTWALLEFGGAMAEMIPEVNALKGKYQHLDRSKIKDVKDLQFDFVDVDPAGTKPLIEAITEVEKTGEGAYAGTVDGSKATDSDWFDADTLKELGGKAGAVPFTAQLDGQGRLSKMTLQMPASATSKAQEITVTYADYGTATPVRKPPADKIVEASDDVYDMLT
ncbi:hypothetical protein ABZ793_04895 [Micromonospora sp. NPDC047465]|uniref:hypothetical protein n=1 Tax=Micromonospora sp. NPDC047465 TaxID=3154813 RepID=UPI0033F411BE